MNEKYDVSDKTEKIYERTILDRGEKGNDQKKIENKNTRKQKWLNTRMTKKENLLLTEKHDRLIKFFFVVWKTVQPHLQKY